jgi:hypothetical protein
MIKLLHFAELSGNSFSYRIQRGRLLGLNSDGVFVAQCFVGASYIGKMSVRGNQPVDSVTPHRFTHTLEQSSSVLNQLWHGDNQEHGHHDEHENEDHFQKVLCCRVIVVINQKKDGYGDATDLKPRTVDIARPM